MRSLRAVLLYAALTVAFTWPLAAHLRTVDAGDAAFFTWAIAWEVHALSGDLSQLPHGNIFHPLRYTLGLDEPVLGTTLLVLPLALLTHDAVLLFNLARLLTFVASGLTAYWLARSLGCAELPSLLAGGAFALSPIRTDQIAHLSTLGTQWLPLVLLFLHRFARNGRVRDAALAGLFFVLSSLACGYHGVIALATLPPAALVLLWGRWERWRGALVGLLVAAAGLAPLYFLHRAALQPLDYARDAAETVFYSASLETFLAASSHNRLWGEATSPFRTTHANDLFPGLVLPLLVLLAGVSLWRRWRRPGRDTVALAVLALGAAAVALGPEVRLFGRTLFPGPFAALREAVPLFQNIRVTSRAGALIALPLAVLAAKAVGTLGLASGARAVAVAALAAAETVMAPLPIPAWTQVVDNRAPPPVYEWLAGQPGELAVLELPMLDVRGVFRRPAYHESVYMVWSTRHWKRLVNGYAGVEPPLHLHLRSLARYFPSEALFTELRRIGVRYLILHRGGYGPNQWARIERGLPSHADSLREVVRFGGDVVFELVEPAR